MKIIISESQLQAIILEQNSSLIPQKGYQAISRIEGKFSYMDGDKVKGHLYTGKEMESSISSYIASTIGLDNWFKINDTFRTELYAYMFQTDSGNGVRHNRWIAGLAQAISPKINRGTILDKPINDPNVQTAINLIKTACGDGTINNYMNRWISVVDDQYSKTTSASSSNYEKIWKYRPTAIKRIMAGDEINKVLDDWSKLNNGGTVEDKPLDHTQNIEITIKSPDLTHFLADIRTKTENKQIDLTSVTIDVDALSFSAKISDNVSEVRRLVLAISKPNMDCESCTMILNKNEGSSIVKEGTFENGTRKFNLISIHI
jgi:hypothetical protein